MGFPIELVRESLRAIQATSERTDRAVMLYRVLYRIESREGLSLGFMHYYGPEERWLFYPEHDGTHALSSEQLRDLHSVCQILHCFTTAEEFLLTNPSYQ